MEQGFPQNVVWRSISPIELWIHLSLFSVIATIFFLFLRASNTSAQKRNVWTWTAVLAVVPILTYSFELLFPDESTRVPPFHSGMNYVLFVWVIGTVAMAINHRPMTLPTAAYERSLAYRMSFGIGCLIFLGFGLQLLGTGIADSREAARRTVCKNNLKQIGGALAEFQAQAGSFPRGATGEPPVSWRVNLLPFFGEQTLFEQYDQSKSWDAPANSPPARQKVMSYVCPSRTRFLDARRDDQYRYYTDYVYVTGKGTIQSPDGPLTSRDVKDGISNTIAVVEASGLQVVWTERRDFDTSQQPVGMNLKGAGPTDSPGMMSSYHPGGAHAVFANGAVRLLSNDIDSRVLKALTTAAAGDEIPGTKY